MNRQIIPLCSPDEMQELLARIYELEKQNVLMQESLIMALQALRKLQAKVNTDE